MAGARATKVGARGHGGKLVLRVPTGGEVDAVAFSPDGTWLAAVDWRSELVLFETWNPEVRAVRRGVHRKTGVAWVAGGARLLTLEWRSLTLWDASALVGASGARDGALATIELPPDTVAPRMRVSPDGRWCAVRCARGGTGATMLHLYAVGERDLEPSDTLPMESSTAGFAFAGGALWVAHAQGLREHAYRDGLAPSGRAIAMAMPLVLAFAPNGGRFVASVYDDALRRRALELRAVDGGALLARWTDAVDYLCDDALCFGHDGLTIAAAGDDPASSGRRTIVRFDAAMAARLPFSVQLRQTISGIDVTPDGTTLAAACRDGAVRLWDLAANR